MNAPLKIVRTETEQLIFEAKSVAHTLNQNDRIGQAEFEEKLLAECRFLCRGDEVKAQLLASVVVGE